MLLYVSKGRWREEVGGGGGGGVASVNSLCLECEQCQCQFSSGWYLYARKIITTGNLQSAFRNSKHFTT